MLTTLCTPALAFTLIAPATVLLPITSSLHPHGLSQADTVALHAQFDPSLGSLRAGRVDAPTSFATQERAELGAAEQNSAALAAMRGGSGPSTNEWTWLAIGAGIVLLIVLL